MSKREREKGNRGERWVVNTLKAAGFEDATRNYTDKLDGMGVDVFAGNLLIQVKNHNKSVPMSRYDEIKRTDGIRALVSKHGRKPWMITMSFSDFLSIAQDIGVLYDKGLIPPF